MVTWLDVFAKNEQYQDLLKQAEQHRLINTIREGNQRPHQWLFYLVSSWLIGLLP